MMLKIAMEVKKVLKYEGHAIILCTIGHYSIFVHLYNKQVRHDKYAVLDMKKLNLDS